MPIAIAIALAMVLSLSGCRSARSEISATQEDWEFFQLATTEQIDRFHSYSVEGQYELLIIGNELVEPPAIFLVKEFARNGPTILPLIREKLVETKNEITVRDIIAVISELHRLNLYDAANDSSLMALATKRVLAMNGQWRSTTLQMLEEIRETPSPK